LNYGHTIGHAIEATTNYFIPHGIAVLIGMLIENIFLYGDKYDYINNFILELIDPKFFNIEFNYSEFIKHILSDKKNKGNDVCFILLDEIGQSKIIYKNINNVEKIMSDIFVKFFKKVV
jgi:3-dehydroquinate synthase